jgi:hypothetical protein
MINSEYIKNSKVTMSMFGSYVSMCAELSIQPVTYKELTLSEYNKVRETYLAFKRR